ncbi:MAG: SH3 domain-containing protein [Christensenellales bacterium]
MRPIKRGLLLLLTLALALGLLPVHSLAAPLQEGQYAFVVGTSSLNLRSGPGYQYSILGNSPRGEMVQVLSYDISTWWRVLQLSSGISGYMDSAFLGASPETLVTPLPTYPEYPSYPTYPSYPGNTLVAVRNPIPSQFLNLRKSPSYSAPILGIYYNGTLCTLISETAGWYQVEMQSGLRGYFRSEYLSFDLNVTPPANHGLKGNARVVSSGGKVNLRQGPDYSYPVLASFSPGTIVGVFSRGSAFWQVLAEGRNGFIDGKYLSDSGSVTPPPSQGNATVKAGVGSLNLRQEPSTSSKVLGTYPAGTSALVKQQGLEWCYVSIPATGKAGYFMTKFLTLSGLPEIPVKIVKQPSGSYVNLRNLPSLSGGVVNMKVPHNSVVTILAPGSQWSRVRFGTVNGYMMSSFLK